MMTDEGAYAPATPLLQATEIAYRSTTSTAPTMAELETTLAQAKARWAVAGLDSAAMQRIDAATVQLADLPGANLGQEVAGTIYVDIDAAGNGWYIDRTPGDDLEFRNVDGILVARNGAASGHIDLLSVLEHELGHVAGQDHSEEGVMVSTLDVGVRTTRVDASAVQPVLKVPGDQLRQTTSADQPAAKVRAKFDALPDAITSGQQAPIPAIDWLNGDIGSAQWLATPSANKVQGWQNSFVNDLARNEKQRSPNASLRIQIDVAPRVTAELKTAHSRV
jgi:hypothetical protein